MSEPGNAPVCSARGPCGRWGNPTGAGLWIEHLFDEPDELVSLINGLDMPTLQPLRVISVDRVPTKGDKTVRESELDFRWYSLVTDIALVPWRCDDRAAPQSPLEDLHLEEEKRR